MGRRTSHRACVMGDTRSGHDRIHRELRWRASQLGRRYKCPIARSSRRCGLQSLLSLVGRLASLRLSRLILSSIFAPVHRQPNHRVGLILSYPILQSSIAYSVGLLTVAANHRPTRPGTFRRFFFAFGFAGAVPSCSLISNFSRPFRFSDFFWPSAACSFACSRVRARGKPSARTNRIRRAAVVRAGLREREREILGTTATLDSSK